MANRLTKCFFTMTAVAGLAIPLAGCDNEQEVFEADTPAGDVEVERDRDTGAVDVEVSDED